IDIDRAEIVDHRGDPSALGVRQQVVDKSGLARPKETGHEQNRDRHNQPSATGRRTGRPGLAARSSTPSDISGWPLTTRCRTPSDGRFMAENVARSVSASK